MRKLLLLILIGWTQLGAAADWQRPDCSGYDEFSECRNAVRNAYRTQKNTELKALGLSFWYFERPDFGGEAYKEAFKDKVEGLITVSFDVEKDGKTSNVELKYASSEKVKVYLPAFTEAMKNWLFVPVDASVKGVTWDYNLFFEQDSCDKEVSSEPQESDSKECEEK